MQVDTIYYDDKSCQAMTNMVNCTEVRLKRLRIFTARRIYVDTFNKYVTKLQYFKQEAISSMWEVSGWLEWKQGPNDFDSGSHQTSFQPHRIEPGDAQTQNTRNGTLNIHLTHTQIPRFIQLLCTQDKFTIQQLGRGRTSRVENKKFNKFIRWKNDMSI